MEVSVDSVAAAPPVRGELEPLARPRLAAVSTALVQLYRRFYGRGPTRSHTIAENDILTTVLEDILTTVERTLLERGRKELVVEMRTAFQAAMAADFIAEVERVTGRPVVAFSSGVDVDREVATETFVLAPSHAKAPASETVRQADPRRRRDVRDRAQETREMARAVRAQARQAMRQQSAAEGPSD
jgi:uncharacterized protein YbcI